MFEWFAAKVPLLTEPVGQLLHEAAPASLYEFCAHTVQLDEPWGAYVPAAQVTLPPGAPRALPPAHDDPAGHVCGE
jgi:hypothetical protein